ncbi:MFS transporter [Myceligenerans indicum]|uniref:MFS transporter n=1 Tax=Myceligenerans indicum TaxID=2593663 RepID=A0ABS1LQG6_9MICO|nr:MFS transporter [Myceligenerans indicum]MBL0888547.1 MFS transporter [Myceligenerans indicum]
MCIRDSRTTGHQRAALLVLLTASFTLAVDFSILNVALPAIGTDIGLGISHLQWIATVFALCSAGFTLLMGRVADITGRRRTFLAGMILLGAGSLTGGLATTPTILLAARAAQGLATATVVPAALALLIGTFTEGPARDKALGLNGSLMAAGFTTGAILGGLLTDLLSWRWAFLINVPIAVAVLATAPIVLQESRAHERTRLDIPGALTATLALLALVHGLTHAAETTWTDPVTLAALAAAVVLLAVFVAVERAVPVPLVPLRMLTRPSVAWGNVAGLLAFATETSLVFLLTIYLQKVLGYTPLAAGLSFAVLGLGTVLGGLAGPKVIARFGSRTAIVGGFLLQAAATLPLVLISAAAGSIWLVLVATFAGGVANLVVIVGFMVTATADVPASEHGLATGLTTMSQQVGIALGTPVMSAVLTAVALGAAPGPGTTTVLDGVTAAIWVNGGACVAAAAAVGIFLRRRARA